MNEEIENHFNKVITNYEEKLQKNSPDFKLSEFEKILLKEGLIYGYEYAVFKQLERK